MKWITTLFLSISTIAVWAQGYNYKFKIEGIKDTTIYMANYYGGKQYYNDTAEVNSKGEFAFTGENEKPGGIYTIIMPDKSGYMEVVINGEKSFTIETKKNDLVGSAKITGSKENKAFYEYLKYVTESSTIGRDLDTKLKATDDKKVKEKLREELNKLQAEGTAYRENFVKENSDLFAAKILSTSRDPEVPEAPKLEDGSVDSNFQYVYFKEHYFDNVDFRDPRLLRTPILHKKIDYYLKKLTPQIPDSVCAAIEHMATLAGDTGLIFKYIVQYSTTEYEKSKIMGMDAVFICMADKYYSKGKATWVDSTQLNDILENFNVRKNLILGAYAEDITLLDTADNWTSLYDVDASYTVLVFWDPNCGHCKKELPKLQKEYLKWQEAGKDIEVFGVSTEFENGDLVKFIKKNNLTFVNVSDNPEVNENAWKYITKGETTLNSLNFRDYWDIYSTPQFYLLDKNKKIIAKRLTADQIEGFVEEYEKRNP